MNFQEMQQIQYKLQQERQQALKIAKDAIIKAQIEYERLVQYYNLLGV